MRKTQRVLSLILAGIMVFSLAACGNKPDQKETKNPSGGETQNGDPNAIVLNTDGGQEKLPLVGDIKCEMPISTNGLKIDVLASTGYDWTNMIVWQEYEKLSGVHVNWTLVKSSERKQKIATSLQGGADLDLIMRGKVSIQNLVTYAENGLILDLNKDDLLKKYAPNCYRYLQNHPDTLASIQTPEGSIYALPQVCAGPELRVSRKLFINKKWMENCGLDPVKDLPKSTTDVYNLLKTFKTKDANGNGDPNDEIPFCTADWASLQDVFMGAFGLGTRGQHNQVVDADEATGKARLIQTSDGYKKMLEWMNKLYSEGLMDAEQFTITSASWTTKVADDRVGMFGSTNIAGVPSALSDNWVCITEAPEGPDGSKLWAPIRANFHSVGNAIIPVTCDCVPEVLRWLDYFWTDEGTLLYHYGVEGVTYKKVTNADGSVGYEYLPSVFEAAGKDASFDDAVGQISPYPGGGNPTVEVAPYFGGGEMAPVAAAGARALFEYGPKEYWPSLTFTADESEIITPILADIKKIYDSAKSEFIMGTKSFGEWDSYCKEINKCGVNELLKVYDKAVDRYHALLK